MSVTISVERREGIAYLAESFVDLIEGLLRERFNQGQLSERSTTPRTARRG